MSKPSLFILGRVDTTPSHPFKTDHCFSHLAIATHRDHHACSEHFPYLHYLDARRCSADIRRREHTLLWIYHTPDFDVHFEWQTTWDRSSLFTYTNLGSNPINFVSPSVIGSADISVEDGSTFQTIVGLGGTLSVSQFHVFRCSRLTLHVADSAAELLNNLKTQNSNNYWALLNYLFNRKSIVVSMYAFRRLNHRRLATDGDNAAGLSYLRVPLGASDFSANSKQCHCLSILL